MYCWTKKEYYEYTRATNFPDTSWNVQPTINEVWTVIHFLKNWLHCLQPLQHANAMHKACSRNGIQINSIDIEVLQHTNGNPPTDINIDNMKLRRSSHSYKGQLKSSLTKILSWNVIKSCLFFNIAPTPSLRSKHFFHWHYSAWSNWSKKIINSKYDVIIWTFQPTIVSFL